MEQILDELILNASLLKECEEEKGECAELQHQQERLLNKLLKLEVPALSNYRVLEKKIAKLSHLNHKLLRPVVKKARTHRKKIKPTQLSFLIEG